MPDAPLAAAAAAAPTLPADPPTDGLNPDQLDAVVHRGGPLLVVACAGSGKTRVLTHRIAHLVHEGVHPSRILAITERPITLLFYTALAGSVVFGLALPWTWDNQTPSYLELGLFVGMGAAGGLGHYFFTLAYRYATASFLAPVIYLQLVWAGLLGWLIFGSSPDSLSLLGMVIVGGSGLMIAIKSRFGPKKKR